MLVTHGQGWVALSASTIVLPAPGPWPQQRVHSRRTRTPRLGGSAEAPTLVFLLLLLPCSIECVSRHLKVAEMVVGQAKRLLESRNDVVILLEGIARLARPSSAVVPFCGKVLSGGAERLLSAPNASSGDPDPADRPVVPCTVFAPHS